MMDKLTVPQKLLLAALSAARTSETFTAEDLVVEAWKLYPDTFGLAGYAKEHPDSNRVLTNIMGDKGLRGKGWIRKVGEKQYRLTSVALQDAEALQAVSSDSSSGGFLRAELERRTATLLERLLSTTAARKILGDAGGSLTFNDACGFWDISPRSNASTLSIRLADVEALLERARDVLSKGSNAEGIRLATLNVSSMDIEMLIKASKAMQDIFARELDVIRQRTDERVGRRRSGF